MWKKLKLFADFIFTWGLLVLFVGGLGWWLFRPYGGVAEILFLARSAVLLLAVSAFAQMRLYNAIVANTRFTIKLREALLKMQQSLPTLERILRTTTNALGSTSTSLDRLEKSVEKSSKDVVNSAENVSKKINELINKA